MISGGNLELEEKKARLKSLFSDDKPNYDPFSFINTANTYKKIKDIGMDVIVPFICENPQYARFFLEERVPRSLKGLLMSNVRNFREEILKHKNDNPDEITWAEELIRRGNKDSFIAVKNAKLESSKHASFLDMMRLEAILNIYGAAYLGEPLLPKGITFLGMHTTDVLEDMFKNLDGETIQSMFISKDKTALKPEAESVLNAIIKGSVVNISNAEKSEQDRIKYMMLHYAFKNKQPQGAIDLPTKDPMEKIFPEGKITTERLFAFINDESKVKDEISNFFRALRKSDPKYILGMAEAFDAASSEVHIDKFVQRIGSFPSTTELHFFIKTMFSFINPKNQPLADRFVKHIVGDLLRNDNLDKKTIDKFDRFESAILSNPWSLRALAQLFVDTIDEKDADNKLLAKLTGSSLLYKAFVKCKDAPVVKSKSKFKFNIELISIQEELKEKVKFRQTEYDYFIKIPFDPAKQTDEQKKVLEGTDPDKRFALYLDCLQRFKELVSRFNPFEQEHYASYLKEMIGCPKDQPSVMSFINTKIKELTTCDYLVNDLKKKEDIEKDKSTLNLMRYPSPDQRFSVSDSLLNIGDMHSNAIKFSQIMLLHDIFDMNEKDYIKLIELYHVPAAFFTKDHRRELETIIDNNIKVVDKSVWINFIGDMLADRGSSDPFVLLLLRKLGDAGCHYDIDWSNHDNVFLRALKSLSSPVFQASLGQGQAASLENLHMMIQTGVFKLDEINEWVDKYYKPNLKLINYAVSADGNTIDLFTHASVGFDTLMDFALQHGIPYRDGSIKELTSFLDEINQYVMDHFDELMLSANSISDVKTLEGRKLSPFEAFFWNRSYDQFLDRPSARNGYNIRWHHGHDKAEKNRPKHVDCQDKDWSKDAYANVTPLKDAGFNVLRNLIYRPKLVRRNATYQIKTPTRSRKASDENIVPSISPSMSAISPSTSAPAPSRQRATAMSSPSVDESASISPERKTWLDFNTAKNSLAWEKDKSKHETLYDDLIKQQNAYLSEKFGRPKLGDGKEINKQLEILARITNHIQLEKGQLFDPKRIKGFNMDKVNKILVLNELQHRIRAEPEKSIDMLVIAIKADYKPEEQKLIFQGATQELIDNLMRIHLGMGSLSQTSTLFKDAASSSPKTTGESPSPTSPRSDDDEKLHH